MINDRDGVALQAYTGWQANGGGNYVSADFNRPYDRNYVVARRCQPSPFDTGWNDTLYIRYDDCQPTQTLTLLRGKYTVSGPEERALGAT